MAHSCAMLTDVRLLGPDDALSTFALARLREAGLSLSDWQDELAHPHAAQGVWAGFRQSRPVALLRYIVTHTVTDVEVTVVRWVTAFDLINPQGMATALAEEVRTKVTGRGGLLAWAPADTARSGLTDAMANGAVLHSVL